MKHFTPTEVDQINSKGITIEQIENQLNGFKNGFPFAKLTAAATVGHGILKMDDITLSNYVQYYKQAVVDYDIVKFVPASGAASRMFQHLFSFRDALKTKPYEELISQKEHSLVKSFFEQIKDFAFYPDLEILLQSKPYRDHTEYALECLNLLLNSEGLDYAAKPKALLKFHRYKDGNRLAMEEHLVEAAEYAKAKNNISKIHFTVSPDHIEGFENAIKSHKDKYEKQFNTHYEIDLSTQKPATDTIAADLNNEAFRGADGKLIFRPGGHGALIENLNELDADLIFIKNIDNVVSDDKRAISNLYKKALGGFALQLFSKRNELLEALQHGNKIEESIQFIQRDLGLPNVLEEMSTEPKIAELIQILNRPLRVCGVVPNVGEPGGGPFWVQKPEGESLQIVESAEIDMRIAEQKEIMLKATHFNPVDLICLTKDFKGNRFDLNQFVDHKAGFISEKSKDGQVLKAMELPGLWNGAMAFWTTLFVEVPLDTFNPVKTINDLLRPMHL